MSRNAVTLAIMVAFGLSGCGAPQVKEPTEADSAASIAASETAPKSEAAEVSYGPEIQVASDPRATYLLVERHSLGKGRVSITTRRSGPSGVSFARRTVDCRSMTFKYTGDADTLEEMERNPVDGPMGDLVEGSISDVISRYACRR